MARPDKAATVAELASEFERSTAVVLTEYRGLTVKNVTELRRVLDGNARYAVVKNTLTKIAATRAGVSGLDEHLAGPSAIAFVSGDPVEAAKGLRDFARSHPALVIKAGVLDGRTLTAAEIGRLADLESREVLLARLAGAMTASLSGAVALFAAPLSQTARLVEALRQKVEQSAPASPEPAGPAAAAEATGDGAPVDEAPPGGAPVDEAPTGGAPIDEAPSGEPSTDEAAPDPAAPEAPSGDSSAAAEAVGDGAPADTVPVADSVPAETVPADTVPADTVPADAVPADAVPADTEDPSA